MSGSGWNRGTGATKPAPQKKPGVMRGAIAGLAVVAVLGVAAFFIFGGKDTKPKAVEAESTSKKIADAKPLVSRKAHTNALESSSAKDSVPEKEPFVKRPGALQLPDGKVLTFPPPQEGHTRKVYAYGRMYECDHLGNFKDLTTRQLFKTSFEGNFLALACQGRTFIPAFLTGLDQDEVKKILLKDYQPVGDETPEEMAQLKNYFEMKCAALDYMEQGGRFDDFVNDIVKFDKEQKMTQVASLREIISLCREGRFAEAKATAEVAKDLMEKKGYQPLRLPPRLQETLEAVQTP